MAKKRLTVNQKAYNEAIQLLKNRIGYYKGKGWNVELDIPTTPKRIYKKDIAEIYKLAEYENIQQYITLPMDENEVVTGEDVVNSMFLDELINKLQEPVETFRTDSKGKTREAMPQAIQQSMVDKNYLLRIVQDEIDNDPMGLAERLESNWQEIEHDIESILGGWYSTDIHASFTRLFEIIRGGSLTLSDSIYLDDLESLYGGNYEY